MILLLGDAIISLVFDNMSTVIPTEHKHILRHNFINLLGGKLKDVSGALILTPSFVFGCLFIFILLADYAQKVAFKKCESFYSVIIINGFLGIVLPSFLSLRVYRNGEQFIISHLWVMVVGMLVNNSFTGEIEVADFL